MKKGKVYLIGAGPGDPGLITVKGKEALENADVILYDKLANEELINYARKDAEKIFVGKEAGIHHVRQEDTILLMTEKALEGKTVARLKGGDPLVFGRGSEEAAELKEAGIEFEFIPGITAATGASAYAGIPLTHRNLVTQCVMVTAHEAPSKPESQVEWEKLAQMKHTTIVIYMGARLLPDISRTLIYFGMPQDSPAAVVERGTHPDQRVVTGTIGDISKLVNDNGLKAPFITIIGPAVELRKQIAWFENKPLSGKRIAVTRAKDQAQSLYHMLAEQGASVVPFPVIRTRAAIPETPAGKMLSENNYDWILFTSENGVRWFFHSLEGEGLDSRILGGVKIAAIGTGTAKMLGNYGLVPDFVPSVFTSATLISELSSGIDIKDNRFLRVKGYFDTDPLTDGLRNGGAVVDTCGVYELGPDDPGEAAITDLVENGADAVIFTSVSTVDNFFECLGAEKASEILRNSKALAIGPVTARGMENSGVEEIIISGKHNLEGIVETLLDMF